VSRSCAGGGGGGPGGKLRTVCKDSSSYKELFSENFTSDKQSRGGGSVGYRINFRYIILVQA